MKTNPLEELNRALQEERLPQGLAQLAVDVDGLISVDPKCSVDVVVEYDTKIRRWFHVMTFDAVNAYSTPKATPVVFGMPLIVINQIAAEPIVDAILKYLAREEGLAEQCRYPDGTISGGINLEAQRLYHLGLLSSDNTDI